MYEARQNKEKVSRMIGGWGRQRKEFENKTLARKNLLQLMWGGDSDGGEYVFKSTDAPSSYKDIAQTDYDKDHNRLNDEVKVLERSGKAPFLWWEPGYRRDIKENFDMRGSRSADKAALGQESGFTWHHCGDWRPGGKHGFGKCTMQQVDTKDHDSFGHTGAIQQYEEATRRKYGK